MSTTITQTEQRTVVKATTVLEKRATFIRTTSIEKLKKFNNFVCSQHYYILPGILLWLKQSQSLFRTQMEKCLMYLKTISIICVLRQIIQDKIVLLSTTNKHYTVVVKNNLDYHLTSLKAKIFDLYEELNRFLLKSSVYLGLTLIAVQTIGCVVFIVMNLPPLGFFFLIGCVAVMARIKFKILDKIEQKAEKNKHFDAFNVAGKTISKVKLF